MIPKNIIFMSLACVILFICSFVVYFHDGNKEDIGEKKKNIHTLTYKSKGDKNDTQNIQGLMNSIDTSKKTILLFPRGTYVLNAPIKICKSVIIKGDHAVFKLGKNFTSNEYGQGFFYAENINEVEINNIIFDGNKLFVKKNPQNNFVALFNNSSHIKIKNCQIKNINGGGHNLNSSFAFVGNSNFVTVTDCYFSNSNCGAVFFQGKYGTASKNRVKNLEDVAFVANGVGSGHINFINNVINSSSGGSIGIENGASNIKITNNKIYNITNGYGVGILKLRDNSKSTSRNIVINNNVIMGNSGFNPCNGIAIVRANNVDVKNNIISNINLDNEHNNSIYIGKLTEKIKVYKNTIKNTAANSILNISIGKENYIKNNKIK